MNVKRTDVSPSVSKTAKSEGTGADNRIIDAESYNSIPSASAINLSLLTRTIANRPANEDSIRGIVI